MIPTFRINNNVLSYFISYTLYHNNISAKTDTQIYMIKGENMYELYHNTVHIFDEQIIIFDDFFLKYVTGPKDQEYFIPYTSSYQFKRNLIKNLSKQNRNKKYRAYYIQLCKNVIDYLSYQLRLLNSQHKIYTVEGVNNQ